MPEPGPLLLAVDAGSTHVKAALFELDGACVAEFSLPTPVHTAPQGYRYIDPRELWQATLRLFEQLGQAVPLSRVAGIGIASMAETGLLVDRAGSQERSVLFPWFDTHAAGAAGRLAQAAPAAERYLLSGIYPTYKCALAKILWAQQELGLDPHGACWLSTADYLVFCLTGAMVTDYSLAGRTHAFRILEKEWDATWLAELGLPVDLFPEARQAGQPAGALRASIAGPLGLPAAIPVGVAGHDHVCAALAVGAIWPGVVLDSMGTAEALAGTLPLRPLTTRELQSGFSISCHVVANRLCWLGGLSASGGSLEWLRGLWPGPALGYADLITALDDAPDEPGEILYFPYLSGSSSPHVNPAVRGAFVGLRATHRLGHLVRAVLEGTAYEVDFLRRRAQALTEDDLAVMKVTGGGARNRRWLQIKSDITGCRYEVARTAEAVLLGAALIAGLCAGLYSDAEAAVNATARPPESIFIPQPARHLRYQQMYHQGYLPMKTAVSGYNPDNFSIKDA